MSPEVKKMFVLFQFNQGEIVASQLLHFLFKSKSDFYHNNFLLNLKHLQWPGYVLVKLYWENWIMERWVHGVKPIGVQHKILHSDKLITILLHTGLAS